MLKPTLLSALALALTASATASASPGVALDTIIVRGNVAQVEYSSKLVGCAVITDEDGYRLQASKRMFCDKGLEMFVDYSLRDLDVYPGEWVQMCTLHDPTDCSDPVKVREAGDLNGDGDINVADLYLLHNTVLNGVAPEGWPVVDADKLAADLNGDSELNVIDILLLVQAMNLNGE
jgi:hypothetical protein